MQVSPVVWTRAMMIAGNPAVDFVNTLGASEHGPIDQLGNAETFAQWAYIAGLADERALSRMREDAQREPRGAASLYEKASALRGALAAIFAAIAAHRPAGKRDLDCIDLWLRRGAELSEIEPGAGGYRRGFREGAPECEKPLVGIARAAEDLLLSGKFNRLHVCAGPDCGWMFVDESKNGRRRWCSMSTCGTAAKVKKFRQRKKTTASSASTSRKRA